MRVHIQPKLSVKPPSSTIQPGGAMNVGGNYTVTVQIAGQPAQWTFNLTQQEATLTGNVVTPQGTKPIKVGKVTTDGFSFSANIEIGGSANDVTFTGKVTGNQISGTAATTSGAIDRKARPIVSP